MNLKKIIIKLIIIIFIFIFITAIYMCIKNITPIIESGGGFETAYVSWHDKQDIFSYHVYIKKADEKNYEQIDNELIRKYKKGNQIYWRADAIGLEQGEYQFKIVPIIEQKEDEKGSIVTGKVSVKANIREGFSFSKNSTNGGKSSGGYLENGKAPEDAKIIYITKENVNSVTLDVKKDNGEEEKAVGLSEILEKWKDEAYSKYLILRIIGRLEKEDIKEIKITNCNGVTIEGVGKDATLKGIGVSIQASSNIEIRNLGMMLFQEDAICIEKNNFNIWVHNNDFFYGENGEEDKAKGDGGIDIKESKYITISYNHYWDSGKTSLCGVNNDLDYITYHHNWFDYTDSRSPRVRYASVHIYNNYYVGNSLYSIASTNNSSVFVEANYFKNCRFPMLISGQGSELPKHILGDEEGGMIKAYNNLIEGKTKSIVYTNKDNLQFDAYLAENRTEQVPEGYYTSNGKNVYNNFDTNSEIMYDYSADKPSEVKAVVTSEAGRLQGGDIKFNTSRLSMLSHSRLDNKEKELDNLINSYEASVIFVQNNK